MHYEPLHHKYRPQTFAQLVGQGAIATTLSSALTQQRIAPAYLFCGPRGTGKTSSARILAKSLNCLSSDRPTPEPCGKCQTCQEIATGIALDVIEIDAASNTGVDNIRELIERAQFAPVQCRYKLYVLDEVHMLSTAAFNALLKTLEEPPERVVFVLATTDPQRVLPTIISRCQRFDFRRIPLEDMVQHLRHIAQQESIAIAPDAIEIVAQISQGGLRDAESLLDQLGLLDGEVTVERVWDLVGAVPERDLLSLIQAIMSDNGALLLEQVRQLMDRGREPLIVLQSLVAFYRDLLIAKTASTRPDLVAVTAPTWANMCEFAQTLPIPLLLASQQHLRTAEVQVKNTTQPRLWLEITLMGLLPSALATPSLAVAAPQTIPIPAKISLAQPAPSPLPSQPQAPSAQPMSVVETAPPKASPEPTPAPAPIEPVITPPITSPATSPIAPPTTPAVGSMSDIWGQILANLHPFGTRALLKQQGHLLAFDGVEATVGIRSKQLMRMAQDRISNIETAFETVFGHRVKVFLEVITAEDPPADPPSGSPAPNPPQPHSPSDAPTATAMQPPVAPPPAAAPPPAQHSPPIAPPPSANTMPAPEPVSHVSNGGAPPVAEPMANQEPNRQWQPESDLERSVKSLAQFFNGQIVNLDEEESDPAPKKSARKLNQPSQGQMSLFNLSSGKAESSRY
jgi:DNA polymerase III subunit gamma/tau